MRAAFRYVAFLLPALFAPTLPATAQLAPRCAACHLPTGAGVPGAFPALRGTTATLAAKPAGRRYLVLAITRGLSGPIVSGGQTFRGVMPAHATMTDADIAATLNAFVGSAPRFTPAEVAQLRRSGDKLSAADVARLSGAIR